MTQPLSDVLMLLAGEPTHWCPGCRMLHRINVNAPNEHTGAKWKWDGNVEKPTFSPSVNIVGQCHYFIQAGMIEFCGDSKHNLAGKTVPLPTIPEEDREFWKDEEPEGDYTDPKRWKDVSGGSPSSARRSRNRRRQ